MDNKAKYVLILMCITAVTIFAVDILGNYISDSPIVVLITVIGMGVVCCGTIIYLVKYFGHK